MKNIIKVKTQLYQVAMFSYLVKIQHNNKVTSKKRWLWVGTCAMCVHFARNVTVYIFSFIVFLSHIMYVSFLNCYFFFNKLMKRLEINIR